MRRSSPPSGARGSHGYPGPDDLDLDLRPTAGAPRLPSSTSLHASGPTSPLYTIPTPYDEPKTPFQRAMCFLKPILNKPLLALTGLAFVTAFLMLGIWSIVSVTPGHGPPPPGRSAGTKGLTTTQFVAEANMRPVSVQFMTSLKSDGYTMRGLVGGKGSLALLHSLPDAQIKSHPTISSVTDTADLGVTFVLTHGGSSAQDALFWGPFISPTGDGCFVRNGAYVALDFPGHGQSPGPGLNPNLAGVALADIVDKVESPVVLVGRSWGGRVTMNALAELEKRGTTDKVCGLILIAPGGSARLSDAATLSIPLLLVWQRDDNTVSFSHHTTFETQFPNLTPLYLNPMPAGSPKTSSHTPERNRPDVFAAAVGAFMGTLKCK